MKILYSFLLFPGTREPGDVHKSEQNIQYFSKNSRETVLTTEPGEEKKKVLEISCTTIYL